MIHLSEYISEQLFNEGKFNTFPGGNPSYNGAFTDYFGEKLSEGDTVVFVDPKTKYDYFKAKIASLKAGTEQIEDIARLTDVISHNDDAKLPNRKDCSALVKVG